MQPATCCADGGLTAAVDVHYPASGGARAAAVLAADASFSLIVDERVVTVAEVLPYQPGAFYLRELPPLLAVLEGQDELRLVVVDGYADVPVLRGSSSRPLFVTAAGLARMPA